MSKNNDGLALLPNGFVDVLPPFAEAEAHTVRTLMDQFLGFGYQLIKPPLLEFEDSLLAPGPGERLAPETFRLMDPASHRMLGIRSDITAQVARIASSRMGSEPRPLRLTYANDVLRTRGNQMRTERQFTQVGCELLGGTLGLQGDIEICVLAVLGLKAIGISDITLDLTVPGFVSHIMGSDVSDAVSKAVSQRDAMALKALGAEKLAVILEHSGEAQGALQALKSIEFDAADDFCSLVEGLQVALDDLEISDVTISIDPLEQSGFEYHKSFAFTLFSSHVSGELGRGGAYDAAFAQDGDAPAKGFTIYMDTVSKVAKRYEAPEHVEVSCDAPWSKVLELQKQGKRVMRTSK